MKYHHVSPGVTAVTSATCGIGTELSLSALGAGEVHRRGKRLKGSPRGTLSSPICFAFQIFCQSFIFVSEFF